MNLFKLKPSHFKIVTYLLQNREKLTQEIIALETYTSKTSIKTYTRELAEMNVITRTRICVNDTTFERCTFRYEYTVNDEKEWNL